MMMMVMTMMTKTVIGGDWGIWTSGHSETGGTWIIIIIRVITIHSIITIITEPWWLNHHHHHHHLDLWQLNMWKLWENNWWKLRKRRECRELSSRSWWWSSCLWSWSWWWSCLISSWNHDNNDHETSVHIHNTHLTVTRVYQKGYTDQKCDLENFSSSLRTNWHCSD